MREGPRQLTAGPFFLVDEMRELNEAIAVLSELRDAAQVTPPRELAERLDPIVSGFHRKADTSNSVFLRGLAEALEEWLIGHVED